MSSSSQICPVGDLQQHIIRLQNLTGLELFAVGGCVRDILFNQFHNCKCEIHDFDFATQSDPEEILSKLKKTLTETKVHKIGKKFGTISFKDKHLGMIDITSFRTETYKSLNRNPTVNFVKDLNLDLSRRDFTINSIALDCKGHLWDNHNGIDAIKNKELKCINDHSLEEDPVAHSPSNQIQI